jgi:hypothetical protein
MPWFAFAALVLVPGLASSWLPFRKRRTRALRAVPILLVATACAALVVSLTRPASWYERSYPTQAAQIVADAVSANPSLAVFPDAAYGSWLLWKQPSLAGRVVYDSRFELLTDEQLREISVWENAGKDWEAVAPAEAVLVLNEMNPNSQKRIVAFKKSGRLLYRDQAVSVWILPRQL